MPREIPSAVASLQQAARDLQGTDPSPFTPNAYQTLTEIVNDFINDLVSESLRIAKRQKSEIVSINYVQNAGEYLIASRTRRLYRHLGTLGGVLLGGSLSNILAMVQAGGNGLPILGTLVSIGICLIGTFLVAIHIAKE
jgi:hypothetical protein